MKKNLQIGKKIALALILLVTATAMNAADRYLVATGLNWNSTAAWATTSGGAPGASVPGSSDNAIIEGGRTVNITADVTCVNLTFTANTAVTNQVNINSGITLTVTGVVTIPRTVTSGANRIAVGSGTLTAASIAFTSGGGGVRHEITISTGTVNVTGNVTQVGSSGSASFTFTGAGLLRLGGSFLTSGTGTLTPSTGTVEYNAAGAQTVGDFTYNNLVLSTSGAKTVTGATVNGSLILRGTATAAGTSPGYGGSAVLEYNGSSAQSPSTVEFPATLNADLLINNTSGVTLPAAKAINGAVTVNAGTSLTVGAFNFSVSGATTIDGTLTINSATGTKSFGSLVVNSGGTFNSSANEDYGFTGNLTVNGTFTAGTGIYTWSQSAAFSGTATIANIVVSAGPPITLTNNGTLTSSSLTGADAFAQGATGVLNYSGATIGIATFTATAAGNVVNYTLAGAQTVEPVAYSNLVLSGSGVKTTTGITVNDKLSLQGTATVSNNTFTYSTAALEYKGSAAQITTNNEYPTAGTGINQLIIDNAAGVTLNGAKALAGVLTLTNGDLNTTIPNLLTIAAGGTISGGSASSHVNGPLAKTGNTNFTFPVGNGTIYRPISISTLSASATVRATYFLANPRTAFGTAGTGNLLPIKDVSLCEYWDLDDGAAVITATVGLQYSSTSPCNAGGYIGDPASLLVAHFTGGAWQNLGAAPGATGTNMTAGAPSTFSPFTIGTSDAGLNGLPVTFTDVKAAEKGTSVQIDWTNSTESDMSTYVIERSANGIDFTAIGQTAPRSNQFDRVSYTFMDAAPIAGTNFYRIKAVEITGKNVYSRSLRVDIGRSPKGISLYPNPVKGTEITIGFSASKGQYSLNVVNTAGQVVFKQQVNHAGGAVAQTVSLPASLKSGVYSLLISGDNYKETKMFVIQ